MIVSALVLVSIIGNYRARQWFRRISTPLRFRREIKPIAPVVVHWTGILPQDIMRKIAASASVTDAGHVRLACKTTKEGFDESRLHVDCMRAITDTDISKFMFITGLCKWSSRLNSTMKIIFGEVEHLEIECNDPATLFTIFANDLFDKDLDLKMYSIIDPNKKEVLEKIYSSVPAFRSLTKMRWWKSGKCNVNLIMRNNVTYMPIVELKMNNRPPIKNIHF